MENKLVVAKLGEVNANGRVYPTKEEHRQKRLEEVATFNSLYGARNSQEAIDKGLLTVEQLLQWDDIFPEIEYPEEVEALYPDGAYLTPAQAFCCDISVFIEDKGWLHPRHWRFNHRNGTIVFLCHDKLVDEKITMNVSVRSSILARRYMSKFDREGLVGGIRRGVMNIIDGTTDACKTKVAFIGPGPYNRPNWKELLEELNGGGHSSNKLIGLNGLQITGYKKEMMLNSAFIEGIHQFEDDRPMTVRGNGRQKLVDNGKGKSWPEARTRKGRK